MDQVSLRSLNHANHMKSMGLEPTLRITDITTSPADHVGLPHGEVCPNRSVEAVCHRFPGKQSKESVVMTALVMEGAHHPVLVGNGGCKEPSQCLAQGDFRGTGRRPACHRGYRIRPKRAEYQGKSGRLRQHDRQSRGLSSPQGVDLQQVFPHYFADRCWQCHSRSSGAAFSA